jgi:hypothetical protein
MTSLPRCPVCRVSHCPTKVSHPHNRRSEHVLARCPTPLLSHPPIPPGVCT